VVHYWDGHLRARHCLVLFGAQCVGAAAGLQVLARLKSISTPPVYLSTAELDCTDSELQLVRETLTFDLSPLKWAM